MKYPDNTRDTFYFNNMGWLTKVKDALQGENNFKHDLNGNVEEVKNAKNNASTNTFDNANRPLSIFDGVTRSTLTWSISGLQTITDGNNVLSTFERNLNNELTKRTGSDGTFEQITLNPDGYPIAVQNQNGTTTIERDNMHFPTAIIDQYGNRIGYTWDLKHRLTRIDYPVSNTYVEFEYILGTNLPNRVKYNGVVVKTYAYNAIGQLSGSTLNNNTSTTHTYNDANEMTVLVNKTGNTIIQQNNQTLNAMSRIVADVSQPLAPKFALTDETLTHGVDDGLLTRNNVSLTSDANGNVTNLGNGTSFTWLNDRLITIAQNTDITQYTYDAFGVKIKRVKAGIETRYVNDALIGGLATPIVEIDVTHNQNIINVLGAFGEPILRDSAGVKRYYHFDIHGNTVALTNETGTVTDRYSTDDFGAFEQHEGTTIQPFVFMGAYGVQREAENLYWVRERWLDASLGRFLSKDPFPADLSNTQSNNRFVYALNNPSSWMDPSGLKPVNIDVGEALSDVSSAIKIGAKGLANRSYIDESLLGFQAKAWKANNNKWYDPNTFKGGTRANLGSSVKVANGVSGLMKMAKAADVVGNVVNAYTALEMCTISTPTKCNIAISDGLTDLAVDGIIGLGVAGVVIAGVASAPVAAAVGLVAAAAYGLSSNKIKEKSAIYIAPVIEKVKPYVAPYVAPISKKIYEAVSPTVNKVSAYVVQKAQQVTQQVVQKTTQVVQQAKQAVTSTYNSAKQGVSNAYNSAKSWLGW